MNKIKKLCVSVLMAFIVIVMLPSQIYAYPGDNGALAGVTMNQSVDYFSDPIATTSLVTDNDLASSFTLPAAGNKVLYAVLNGTYDISAYRVRSASPLQIRMYDADNNQVGVLYTSEANDGTKINKTWTGVKRVAFYNQTGLTNEVYELDIYGTSPDTTPPAVPTGLSGTAGDGQVDLTWNANATDTAGYNVYMDGTKVNGSLITGTTYSKTGLTNGTAYTFEVSAVDAAGNESVKSSPVTKTPAPPPDTTPPAVPTGLTGIAGDQQVQLSWTANTDDATGYNVYKGGVKVNTSLVTATSYTVTGLTNGTNYTFEITAVDAEGNESDKSAAITKKPFKTLNVNLVPNGTSIIVNVDGGDAPYTVTWSSQSDTFSATTYVIQGLSKATDYTVTVTDDAGSTFTSLINTGTLVGFVPPVMPNPQGLFQQMLDAFGVSGDIGLAVILAAVALGLICILGLFGWRLSKKWLSSAK